MIPYDQSEMLPPLWNELENCSGLRGNFGTVHFFSTSELTADGMDIYGIWLGGLNWIVVVEKLKHNPRLLKHEMMHALLRGGSDHPAHYFNGICGDIR